MNGMWDHYMRNCVFLCLLVLSAGSADAAVVALDQMSARKVLESAWQERVTELKSERAAELEKKNITRGEKSMCWEERVFGDAPTNGHSLWISMHGGGGAP